MLIKNGKNADGQNIYGTPKARNSLNYLIARGASNINSNVTLTKAKSPYLVAGNGNGLVQTFQGNSVLTIESGVVIKFYTNSGLAFLENAAVKAQGVAGDPIVFTSFNDDEYGGDLDKTFSNPYAGGWFGVDIYSTANDTIFNNAIFRYGGQYYTCCALYNRANLSFQNSSATISNSIFEYSKVYGLKLSNSNFTVSNNIFRYNNNFEEGFASGMTIDANSAATVRANTFSQNRVGLRIADSSGTIVDSNNFISNSDKAISSQGLLATFSNNFGSANGKDGIVIANGDITRQNATTTLKSNSLPYIIDGQLCWPNVAVGSALVIEPGVVVKAGGGSSWGADFLFPGIFLLKD